MKWDAARTEFLRRQASGETPVIIRCNVGHAPKDADDFVVADHGRFKGGRLPFDETAWKMFVVNKMCDLFLFESVEKEYREKARLAREWLAANDTTYRRT